MHPSFNIPSESVFIMFSVILTSLQWPPHKLLRIETLCPWVPHQDIPPRSRYAQRFLITGEYIGFILFNDRTEIRSVLSYNRDPKNYRGLRQIVWWTGQYFHTAEWPNKSIKVLANFWHLLWKDIIASRSACIWMQQKNNYDILRMKYQYKDPKWTLAICQRKIQDH